MAAKTTKPATTKQVNQEAQELSQPSRAETPASQENTVNAVLAEIGNATKEFETTSSKRRNAGVEKIELDEEIACQSITVGGLNYASKTGAIYRWNQIGDIEYLPFSELVSMGNSARNFLFAPLIILQDSRAVNYFRLLDTYEKVAQINKLDEVFKQNLTKIAAALDTIKATNMRNVAISKIRKMRHDKKLNDIDVIRLIEDKLSFDLSEDKFKEE